MQINIPDPQKDAAHDSPNQSVRQLERRQTYWRDMKLFHETTRRAYHMLIRHESTTHTPVSVNPINESFLPQNAIARHHISMPQRTTRPNPAQSQILTFS